ncbi:hypothetical protein SLS60_002188 [Paraconiothyrium brasiliense]|uniref:Uncharacterized protein n=1 Tax=Paraconiothyrium brasiliense TaxID=300254 RepID=A0ABR3S1G0_9PLEO
MLLTANWHLPSSTPSIGLVPPLCPPTDRYFPEAWPVPLLKSLLRLSELTIGEKERAVWYLEVAFGVRIREDPSTKRLGVQVVDIESAVAVFEDASRQKVDGKVDLSDEGHEEYQEMLGSQKSMEGNMKPSAETRGSSVETKEQKQPSHKRRHLEYDSDQYTEPDGGTISLLHNPSLQQITRSGPSHSTLGKGPKNIVQYPHCEALPTPSSLPTLASSRQLRPSKVRRLQHEPVDVGPKPGSENHLDEGSNPGNPDAITKIKFVTNVSETAYRQQKEEHEGDIIYTGAKKNGARHAPSQKSSMEALTPQTPSLEPARTKSSRMDLEAEYSRAIEERRKTRERAYKKLVVDVQAARIPQSAPPSVPQVASATSNYPIEEKPSPQGSGRLPSPLFRSPPQTALQHPPAVQFQSPTAHQPQRPLHPQQLAYMQHQAARQQAYAQLSAHTGSFPITPANARHAGPYTPISPQQYAPRSYGLARMPHVPPPLPPNTRQHPPPSPVSPHPYPRPLQSPQHPPPHPPRESAEVMLRKLELEEAEAKLRASIQQERLRAEVLARRKAVARALMMEEQGLR